MISCARLAVPGMIVSMLLAGQALASSPSPADEEAVMHKMPPASVEQKKPVVRRAQTVRRNGRARLERPASYAENDRALLGVVPGPSAGRKSASPRGMRRAMAGASDRQWRRYDEHELTAAHTSLPLGSKVKVSAEATGRSVIVTINDRPGTGSRVIDLWYEAAKQLGLLQFGALR